MNELNQAVCWVTGAAGGIGKAVCSLIMDNGGHLVVSDANEAKLYELCEELKNEQTQILPIVLDVSDQQEVRLAGEKIESMFGRLDVLVNGAGISPKGENGRVLVEDMDPAIWRKVLDINLNGTFYCSQVAVKLMKKHKKGHIVNIASSAGRTYSPITGAHYAASKAAMISLTRQLAGEVGPDGIYVNAVAPGRIDTPMIWDVASEVNENAANNTPLRRLGTPDEVAKAIGFLISEQSSFITGAVIDVNGGRFMV
ncbi:SDR family NAD(P)-dependent oxidoreductase [Brevibacillus centrosporus]|jgi:3-oxoacyl-[acyl-carrier protein] reductase|uniref:SDR family NAD(P)-dependent oxidoreductase n=1 Tax=Brevibacillus centrosporus TaxID=54910 RepID=UPI002E238960|nr:SDR family NAD(P)-dependent oxidoreductase [Brevibacillus centrosporus]